MRCSALQCVAVCCSVLQCAAVCCSVLPCGTAKRQDVTQPCYRLVTPAICVCSFGGCCGCCRCELDVAGVSPVHPATRQIVLCVAVCCSVLQCVAVCCSALLFPHSHVSYHGTFCDAAITHHFCQHSFCILRSTAYVCVCVCERQTEK